MADLALVAQRDDDASPAAQPLPAPLVPPNVDMRTVGGADPWFPLYGERLFRSDTWLAATSDEKVAMLRLWWEAWLQVPSASIPSNDTILASLSGAGADWPAMRNAVLRGWLLCRDGRLYHPFLAEVALGAWERHKMAARERAGNRSRVRKYRSNRLKTHETGNALRNGSVPVTSPLRNGPDRYMESEKEPPPYNPPPTPGGAGGGGGDDAASKPAAPQRAGPLDYSPEFEAWWAVYPRKLAKSGAWASYRRAVKAIAATGQEPHAVLLAGVRAYARRVQREGTEERLIAHATTWLNQGRWQDAAGQPRAAPRRGQSVAF